LLHAFCSTEKSKYSEADNRGGEWSLERENKFKVFRIRREIFIISYFVRRPQLLQSYLFSTTTAAFSEIGHFSFTAIVGGRLLLAELFLLKATPWRSGLLFFSLQ
jgi:hypothetical protein